MKQNSRSRKTNPRSPWWHAPMVNAKPNWEKHREIERRERERNR